MSYEGVPKAIVDGANAAYARGDAAAVDKVIILLDAMHRDIHLIPAETAKLISNGNGRRLRDKAKSAGPPAAGGMGLMAVIFEGLRIIT